MKTDKLLARRSLLAIGFSCSAVGFVDTALAKDRPPVVIEATINALSELDLVESFHEQSRTLIVKEENFPEVVARLSAEGYEFAVLETSRLLTERLTPTHDAYRATTSLPNVVSASGESPTTSSYNFQVIGGSMSLVASG